MQEWIVGLIVVCAFWAVAKRYMPKAIRRALHVQVARTAKRFGWHGIAERFAATEKAVASCGDGCGTCGGCGSNNAAFPSDERFVIKLKAAK